MDLDAAARDIREKRLTSLELTTACLERIARIDPWLRAFAWLDPERALRLARESDRAAAPGALRGVPVAVKDVIDTAGIPTEHGSALFAGRVPARSATIVTRLEDAGAIMLGKTVTAELAYMHPGPTVNPYARSRTPGGSSMGSAAAVAADLVPGACGTQTKGSVIRPAAFCGVIGFKPTFGRIPRDGVLPFAASLDTVGVFATTVAGAALLAAVLAGESPESWRAPAPRRPRFAVVPTGDWPHLEPYARDRFERDCDALARAGASLETPAPPAELEDALAGIDTLQTVEGARAVGPHVDRDRSRASAELRALVKAGRRTTEGVYQRALALQARLAPAFDEWAAAYDAILTPAALGEAPDPSTTGDPRCASRWTFIGAPALVLPVGLGPGSLPLGLQLVSARGADARLLAAAEWARAELPEPPRPAA